MGENKKILAFGASNSKQSINRKLAKFTAERIDGVVVNLLDLNEFEMPIYGIDNENEFGIPKKAFEFKNHLKAADAIIISFAEHNGAYTSAYKNIFDWISRVENDVWGNKPMFLLATSPGGRGATTVLEIAFNKISIMNSNIICQFSLPSFGKNFSEDDGIIDVALMAVFEEQLNKFKEAIL